MHPSSTTPTIYPMLYTTHYLIQEPRHTFLWKEHQQPTFGSQPIQSPSLFRMARQYNPHILATSTFHGYQQQLLKPILSRIIPFIVDFHTQVLWSWMQSSIWYQWMQSILQTTISLIWGPRYKNWTLATSSQSNQQTITTNNNSQLWSPHPTPATCPCSLQCIHPAIQTKSTQIHAPSILQPNYPNITTCYSQQPARRYTLYENGFGTQVPNSFTSNVKRAP